MLRNSTTGFVFCVYLTYSSPDSAHSWGVSYFGIRQRPTLPGVSSRAVSIRGTRTVAVLWPLLAIPDAPPACFRHWRRQAPVPLGAHGEKPSQVQCRTHPEMAREQLSPGRFSPCCIDPGNSHSRAPWPLLAIPDAPPACFRHWRRQAPVPQAARDGKPSQVQCRTHPQTPRELDALPDQKEINPTFVGLISFWPFDKDPAVRVVFSQRAYIVLG